MQRRDLLKMLMSVGSLSAAPIDLVAAVQQAKAETSTSVGLMTLDGHQDATVTAISELIIPATDTPGAKAAKVNEFIDLLLTEWFAKEDKNLFLHGLAQVDVDSRKVFGSDFIACTSAQQIQMMKQLDDEAMAFGRAHKNSRVSQTTEQPANFFYTFKRLTLVGYYTSEIGFKQELGKTIIPPGHSGCAPMPEVKP